MTAEILSNQTYTIYFIVYEFKTIIYSHNSYTWLMIERGNSRI